LLRALKFYSKIPTISLWHNPPRFYNYLCLGVPE